MWALLWPLAKANWKIIAIVVALAALLGWHKWQVSAAYRDGVKSEQARARIEAGKRIAEMEKTDEAFRNLPAVDRCRLFMRDSGLPEHHCVSER